VKSSVEGRIIHRLLRRHCFSDEAVKTIEPEFQIPSFPNPSESLSLKSRVAKSDREVWS